jgi:hypothetical protein
MVRKPASPDGKLIVLVTTPFERMSSLVVHFANDSFASVISDNVRIRTNKINFLLIVPEFFNNTTKIFKKPIAIED